MIVCGVQRITLTMSDLKYFKFRANRVERSNFSDDDFHMSTCITIYECCILLSRNVYSTFEHWSKKIQLTIKSAKICHVLS